MTEDEKKAHALRLVELHNNEYEYSSVYEDEELEDIDEDDWVDIHKYMYAVKITYTFED